VSFQEQNDWNLRVHLQARMIEMTLTDDWEYPWRAQLRMNKPSSRIELIRVDCRGE
jgi:hypothetical protein